MSKPVSRALRARLLLGASFGLLQLGVGGMVALAPTATVAANECGDPSSNGATSDALVCVQGTYAGGITTNTNGNLTLVLSETNTGAVVVPANGILVNGAPGNSILIARIQGVGAGFDPSITGSTGGIRAFGSNANVVVDLTDPDTGDTPISVSATNGAGVQVATSGVGAGTIATSNGTIQANSASAVVGLQASTSGSGAATVNGGATVTATGATGGVGVAAFATGTGTANLNYTGAVSLTSTSGSSIAAQAVGVGGVVSTVSDAKVSTSGGSFSIGANGLSASGTVTLTISKAEAIGANTPFVAAVNGDSNLGAGSATVTLDVGTAIATGTGTSAVTGVNAVTKGLTNVTAATVNVTSAGSAFGIGIGAAKSTGSAVVKATTVTASGTTGMGIGVSATGEVKVTSGSVSTTGLSAGIGVETLTGDITIDSTSVQASGTGAVGIGADGGAKVTITSAAITSTDDGVTVLNSTAYSVQVGTVTAGASAIQTVGSGSGQITTTAGGLVRGNGVGAGNWVIDASSGAAGTLTIANNGVLRSTAGGLGDQVIRAKGGAVIINNAGHIDGVVSFTGLSGTNAVTFNNTSATSWHTTGTSTFSAGNDTLNNTSSGLIATSATTTFDFAGDTGVAPRDVFTNAGALAVGETAGASTLNLTNLETFNNSGAIGLGSTNGAKSDGETNDRLNAAGVTYNASGGATIYLDANLGAATQTDCTAAVSADCVNLSGGVVTGVTKVNIKNVGTTGGLNTTGLMLIDVTGGTASAGAFVLDPTSPNYTSDWGGAIDTGLFDYRIAFNSATKTFAIVSAPDNEALEYPYLGSAASEVWYLTVSPVQPDLSGENDATKRRGVWMKAAGDWARRDASQTYTSAGTSFTFNTSHDQDTWTIMAGADLFSSEDGKWAFGLSGGYVSSDVDFRASPSTATMDGAVLGAYWTYQNAAFHLDGVVNANVLKLKFAQNLPSLASNRANVNSYGARVEGGWRWGQESGFIEPLFSVSFVSTSLGDLAVPGGVAAIDNVTSFRGGLGAKAGGSTTTSSYRVRGSVTLQGWAEFDGDVSARLTNPGTALVVTDEADEAWGEVSASVDILALTGGLSAYVTGGYRFGSDRTGANASVGIRAVW